MVQGIEFDEEKSASVNRAYVRPGEESGMTQWLIKHGLASSGSNAQLVMVGFIVLNLIIAFILIKKFL